MDEQEKRRLEQLLDDIRAGMKSGELSVADAGKRILDNAEDLRKLRAYTDPIKPGYAGYRQVASHVLQNTCLQISKIILEGHNDISVEVMKYYDNGMDMDAIMQELIRHDRKGKIQEEPEFYRKSAELVIAAYEKDKEAVQTSRKLASEVLHSYVVPQSDMNALAPYLAEAGLTVKNPSPENRISEKAHEILVNKALDVFDNQYRIPRWAATLLRKPGMTGEEKQNIQTLWEQGDDGKKAVFEMFFREIEQLPPELLDIKNVEEYINDYDRVQYYGQLTLERELCMAELDALGFEIDPERRADITDIANSVFNVENKFSADLDICECPIYDRLEGLDTASDEKLYGILDKMPPDSLEQTFFLRVMNGTAAKKEDKTRTKEILRDHKILVGEEKVRQLNLWYDGFKKALVSMDIDLDDPVDMARVMASAPGKRMFFMPAVPNTNGEYKDDQMPDYPDIPWYQKHLTAANNLSMEQIEQLYNLAKEGRLAVYGPTINEENMHILYNDRNNVPQVSERLDEVDSAQVFKDEKILSEEFFPDALHPGRIYDRACNLHSAYRNQIPLDKDGYPNFDTGLRLKYTALLFRDYHENRHLYASKEAAEDRSLQVFVYNRYYSDTENKEFRTKYKDYVEKHNISFDDAPTKQEKAIESLFNYRRIEYKVPELTQEMLDFVSSLKPALEEAGIDTDILANRAGLRMFVERTGVFTEIPVCAPLKLKKYDSGYAMLPDKTSDINPNFSENEHYLLRNTNLPGKQADLKTANRDYRDENKIQIAMIYEFAKKGLLLMTKPGSPVSESIPIVPGEDGKAKLLDMNNLTMAEKKSETVRNAGRVRRLYKNPGDPERTTFLGKAGKELDASSYLNNRALLDNVALSFESQARAKGIKSKRAFTEQAVATMPTPTMSFREYCTGLYSPDEEEFSFRPNVIKPGQQAARRSLSELARRNYFESKHDALFADAALKLGVERNLFTAEQAKVLSAERTMLPMIFEYGDSPEVIERNIEAAKIMIKGTNQQKSDFINARLEKFARFKPDNYKELTDRQLVENWSTIQDGMFRLTELINFTDVAKKFGVTMDETKLAQAMVAERHSGDLYYYLSSRMQAIAGPAYESVDIDQLLNLPYSQLNTLSNCENSYYDIELSRVISTCASAKQGLCVYAASYIKNQLIEKLGEPVAETDFYDRDGNPLDTLAVYEEVKKGNVVFAASRNSDEPYAFRSTKGKPFAELQPDSKYKTQLMGLRQMRIDERLEKERAAAEAEENARIRREADIRVKAELRATFKDEVDYLQYKLAGAARNMESGSTAVKDNAEAEARKLLAGLIAKTEIEKKILDANICLSGIKNAVAPKNMEKETKAILDDPAFEDFFKSLTVEELIKVGEQKLDQSFKRELAEQLTNAFRKKSAEKANEAPKPVHNERSLIRDNVRATIRENIEYQQFRLGLVLENYGPDCGYQLPDKEENFKFFSRSCVAEILALEEALERTKDPKLTCEGLKKLAESDTIGEIRLQLTEKEGFEKLVESMNAESMEILSGRKNENKELSKLAAENLLSSYRLENRNIAHREQLKDMELAKQAMKQSNEKYLTYAEALNEAIDYGQFKLAAAARGILSGIRGSENESRKCLATVFAAMSVQNVIRGKVLTSEQAKSIAGKENLKVVTQKICEDPAFTEFCKTLMPEQMIKAGLQKPDGSFDRTDVTKLLASYNKVRAARQQQKNEGVRNNSEPSVH